jgi:alkyl hydroperoxide reductase subunit AhpC
LNELYEEYKEEGLVVLGICTSNRGQETYASTVESTGMKYPVARDPELKTMSEAGWVVKWFPTYVIVDKKGTVRASGVFHEEGMEEIIKTLLAEEVEEDDGEEGESGDDDGGEGAGDDDGGMAGRGEIPADFLGANNTQ